MHRVSVNPLHLGVAALAVVSACAFDPTGALPLDTGADQEAPGPDSGLPSDPLDPSDPTALSCGGTPYGDLCWYLSDLGQSCEETCATRGGTDGDASSLIGTPTEGGSAAQCTAVLEALGHSQRAFWSTRSDGLALGCHRWNDGIGYYLASPAFDSTHSASPAQVVCACNETPCQGTQYEGHCWRLSDLGQSCDETCAARGGFDSEALHHIGTPEQNGSLAECNAVFDALGALQAHRRDDRDGDNQGLGCALWDDGHEWYYTAPTFSASESHPSAQRACACNE